MSTLLTRSLTGAGFVLVLLASVYWHPFSLMGLFFIVAILAWSEFNKLINESDGLVKALSLLTVISIFGTVVGVWLKEISSTTFLVPIIFLGARMILSLFRPDQASVFRLSASLFGIFYTVLPFVFLVLVAFPEQTITSFNPSVVIYLFVLIWIYDSFAYLSGVKFGKHRLHERISPKKSWEGLIGGALVTMGVSLVQLPFVSEYNLFNRLTIAGLIIIFGTLGDLFESMLKREAGIKDSGKILPGHGGILDRFDSMMFIAPVVWIYLQLI